MFRFGLSFWSALIVLAALPCEGFAQPSIRFSRRVAHEIQVSQVVEPDRRRDRFPIRLLVTCNLTDVSSNILWQVTNLVSHQSSGDDASKAVLAEAARRREWENMLAWLKQTIVPAQIYERWYYRGLGESMLSQSGESVITQRD